MLLAVALATVVSRDDGRIARSVQLRDTTHADAACVVPGDSVRPTQALSRLIALAAVAGRTLPPALTGYRVRVESEIALVIRTAAPRDGAGSGGALARERVVQVEQVESALAWSRTGSTDQHVIGFRARSDGECVGPVILSPTVGRAGAVWKPPSSPARSRCCI